MNLFSDRNTVHIHLIQLLYYLLYNLVDFFTIDLPGKNVSVVNVNLLNYLLSHTPQCSFLNLPRECLNGFIFGAEIMQG
jgi:hypothetical protein